MGINQGMKQKATVRLLAFFKLIRLPNLVMIALTQILIRYFVLRKVFVLNGLELGLGDGLFYLVVLSTVLIAAGGYVINDYFDVKTDLINHPNSVVVDRVIKRRWAIVLHLTFTFVGVFIGLYAALMTGYLRLAIFHIAASVLLWFYSTDFKKQLLVGNLVVSLLTAAVAFMPFVYEMGTMQKIHPGFLQDHRGVILSCLKISVIYSLFAFITTLSREIIKDIEDHDGDKATGGHTMPIVWGIRSSKLTAFFLNVITALLLMFVVYNTIKFERSVMSVQVFYICLLLILPLVILSAWVLRSTHSAQFTKASLALKMVMFFGLCYSLVFYYA
jgi:4-hydroxybenzoate polyprenyltransferase